MQFKVPIGDQGAGIQEAGRAKDLALVSLP